MPCVGRRSREKAGVGLLLLQVLLLNHGDGCVGDAGGDDVWRGRGGHAAGHAVVLGEGGLHAPREGLVLEPAAAVHTLERERVRERYRERKSGAIERGKRLGGKKEKDIERERKGSLFNKWC